MGIYDRPDSPFWWIYLENTHRRQKTTILIGITSAQRKESRASAFELYHKLMNEHAGRIHRLPSGRANIRFTAYADTHARDVLSHHKGYERELEIIKVLKKAFGDDLLTTIDRERVQRWVTVRRQAVAARTVNREVALLKTMLRDAVPKYLEASPLVGMKPLKVLVPKRKLMTEDEEAKILEHASATEKAFLLLALDGLVRMGDLLDLRWEDVQPPWLYVKDPKGGHPYEVALSERAVEALEAVPKDHKHVFQIYRGAATDRDRRMRVRRVLMKLCGKAGVPYGRKHGGITFHWATRRTGASRLLVRGNVAIPTVQRQGNWKTPNVLLQIYAESDRQAQLDAVRREPAVNHQKKTGTSGGTD